MKMMSRSVYHIVDAVFVGWYLISYRQFATWSGLVAAFLISLSTAHNAILTLSIIRVIKISEDDSFLIWSCFMGLSGVTMYLTYLRQKGYAHELAESYNADKKMKWYARIVAIMYFFSPVLLGLIHVLVNSDVTR